MVPKALAPVTICAEMMGVVVALEEPVLLDDPGDLRPHVRPDDGAGDFRVIERRQLVPHIVNERRDDELVIRAVAPRARRGLQRMLQPGDRVAAQ